MDTKRSGPQAPRLAEVRSRWLDAVIAALQDDQPVVGAALVGSLCPLLGVISSPLDHLIVLTKLLADGAREVSFVDPQEGGQEVVIAGPADGFALRLPQPLVLEARRGDGCVLVEDHPPAGDYLEPLIAA